MFKKVFVLSLVLSCALLWLIETDRALSQYLEWQRTYGGASADDAQDVRQTSDGGYIIVGSTQSFGGGYDVFLVKTDSLGNAIWTRHYGGKAHDYGECVQQTSDGGYIVVGSTYSYGAGGGDVYLIKTDSLGNVSWSRTYGGTYNDCGHFVQKTFEGGYIIAGRTYSFGPGTPSWNNAYFVKTSFTGDIQWTRAWGTNFMDGAYSVQQTSDSGYIATGWTHIEPGYLRRYDVYLIRLNSAGDTLWTRNYGGSDKSYDDWGEWVENTEDGGYILAGHNSSFQPGNGDAWLIRTYGNGDTIWTRTFGGSNGEGGYSVHPTEDGGYVAVGVTGSFGAGGAGVYLIRTDSLGTKLWTRTYGGSSNDEGRSVRQTSDGGYIVAGLTTSFGAGGSDAYLLKIANRYVCGDANGDDVVDAADVTYLQNYLYNEGPAPEPLGAGDANCNGSINLGDIVYLNNYLYMGGPEPCCP